MTWLTIWIPDILDQKQALSVQFSDQPATNLSFEYQTSLIFRWFMNKDKGDLNTGHLKTGNIRKTGHFIARLLIVPHWNGLWSEYWTISTPFLAIYVFLTFGIFRHNLKNPTFSFQSCFCYNDDIVRSAIYLNMLAVTRIKKGKLYFVDSNYSVLLP